MENLAQLEALCERLYLSQDSAERAYAETTLSCFSKETNLIPQCEYMLDNSKSPYAMLMASSSLVKLVTENNLPLETRLRIRNHVLSCLSAGGANLENFVTTSLIQLLCRVTKFSWFDDVTFQDLVKDSINFLNQATHHYGIGLKILNQLVSEMNQITPELPVTLQRRLARSFKDQSLLQIYEISLTSLSRLKSDAHQKLQELALSLSQRCLSFDYLGGSADETSDEVGVIQIPLSWRSVITKPSTIQIYFDYYFVTDPPLSNLALECLVLLATVRRSVFTSSSTLLAFISSFVIGTKHVLETGKGLNHQDNYHEFCRLLGSFKVNFKLSELVSMEDYRPWISLVSDFTLKSLQSWKWTSNSTYYLLGLWSRMVSSMPYLKGDLSVRSVFDEFVPKILEVFISSRFDCLQAGVSHEFSEDPLDKIELMQDQLSFFPYLCRFQYGSNSKNMLNVLDPLLQAYTEGAKLQDYALIGNLGIIETQLALLVHIVSAIINAKRIPGGESNETIDADLAARILQLISVMDTGSYVKRYGEVSRQRLELAVLSFFESFRETYIAEQEMYVRLSELLGLQDHLLVLDVIVRKIFTNLRCCSEGEELLDQTLSLFLKMASGYTTGKLLLKLDTVHYMLSNCNIDNFHILGNSLSGRRTKFYHAFGLLVFTEDNFSKFKQSMDPLSQVLVRLESTPDHMFRNETVKCALIGLMRDLRGITMATNSRRTFRFLFDWLFPSHTPILMRAVTVWGDSPQVTTPLLKFVAEMVLNSYKRLSFDSSSPNGVLLFREASKVLVSYGLTNLNLPNQKDVYGNKYKGLWLCLVILSRAIAGNFFNFGVFEIYGDKALDDALDVALKMILTVPAAHMLAYPKVAVAYFCFLEIIFGKYIKFAISLDANTFAYLLTSLQSGLKLLDPSIISECTVAIDHLATYYFYHIMMGESPDSPALASFVQHVGKCADIFLDILKTLFEIHLFEDRAGDSWCLHSPMLSLILLSEEMYAKMKTQILASQPVDQQQRLLRCFDIPMANVSRSLDKENRKKFAENLARFRKEFHQK